ncbi:MAG: 4-oxalocrotonate tautomerase [Rhodobacteraceae bacterium]|uniref:4-oxalocrotonate tautomerase n=1 Tax=Albidovulum sp. TaxID=1872424 RepID=UPI001D1EC06D|nr:4-oxalocrotonate tautomerase [Paracoccaceae bacterium]MCC0047268.1 4-oxalocrotonate tautomerase [Defluviimonas sp.]HPE26425.1 4-oxalocrotonate tautomerase [Albidovulum sp.]MCB2119805.1 4-oxalocrotonate tautomerase [Paracoccaceae bacterium]MCB2121527.1 4-oxalocrotonate tautomerase [Paracoccaceae bacterium]
MCGWPRTSPPEVIKTTKGTGMPVIKIEMFEGRTVEQKRACAAAVTQAFIDTCGGTPQSVHVVFQDVARHDWAVAGRLASDPKPE